MKDFLLARLTVNDPLLQKLCHCAGDYFSVVDPDKAKIGDIFRLKTVSGTYYFLEIIQLSPCLALRFRHADSGPTGLRGVVALPYQLKEGECLAGVTHNLVVDITLLRRGKIYSL